MKICDELRQMIAEANKAAGIGQHDTAEKWYLLAIDAAENDWGLVGSLYINLGTNAEASGCDKNAVVYFRKAIEALENLRGDGFLECAHAYYHLAYILLEINHPDATKYAEVALERYECYPYSSQVHMTNARMLCVMTWAYGENSIISSQHHERLQETWRAVLAVKGEGLDQHLLFNFVICFLNIEAKIHPDHTEAYLREISDWVPNELILTLRKVLESNLE